MVNMRGLAVSSCPASSSDIAAWVQAIGSILAILGAVAVAIWQSKKAQEHTLYAIDQQRKSNDLEMANTLIELAANALKLQKHMAEKLDTREKIYTAAEDRLPFDMPMVYALQRSLDKIELHRLQAKFIPHALMIAETFRQVRIKLDMVFDTHRQMDAAAFADFFRTMTQMQDSMRSTVGEMKDALASPSDR